MAQADQWMTTATGTTASNGQAMSLGFGNGVTATYTQGAAINNPAFCGSSQHAAPGGTLGGTNVATFIEPDPPAGSVSVSQCIGNGAAGVLRTVPHSFSFNKPIIGPVLHLQNLDGTVYDVSATTISGGAVTYTQLAKNDAMEVAALNGTTTRFNDTPQPADNGGCMGNGGGNPSGACGSFRMNGGPVQSWSAANRQLIAYNSGDGWTWSVSFQTARLTKAFAAASIQSGQTTALTFTIDNTNATNGTNAATAMPLGPLDFTDIFPAGLSLANGISSSTCSGATVANTSGGTLNAGDTGVQVSGLTVAANASCTVSVSVTAVSSGTYSNTAANMSSTIGNLVLAPSASLTVVPQPGFGSCNARMFLDQVSTASSPNVSTLYNVGYLSSPFTYTSLGTGLARNGIGYNPLDNYIYGIEWDGSSGNELIRVGSDGSSVNLGVIAGLPVGNYSNGVISPAGDYYLTSGSGGATLYRVNIAARTATSISMSQSILVSDLAWYNGLLYGLSGGRLVSVNPGSGVVVDNGSTSPLGSAIAMWGFSNALLASGGGPIYAIDPATGAATLMSSAPAAGNADGANCASAAIQFPADLSVTKTNTPAQGPSDLANDTYVPGETRSYAIVVRNGGPFGAQNVTVSDPVPAGISAGTVSWTCAATSGGSVCGAASGSGALNDTGLNLPSGAVATYTVTMTVPTGFTGALTNTVTVTPPSNVNDPNPANNTATDTDQAAARVTLSKLSLGGVGAFSLSGSNGVAPQTLTTTVAGTAVSGTSQVLTTAGIATTLTEASPPAGYVLSAINCTGLGGGGTATTDLAARTVTLDAAATASGANITCTFTNSRIPLLRLQKALPSGRAAAADQFTLNMTGMAGLTTTGSGSTATGVLTHSGITIGNSYTLSEGGAGATNLANYSSSYACTNALVGGQTPSGTGTSFSVTPVAGDDLTCTLTNTAILADLQVVKTASPPGAVQVGQVVTYTIVATNNGPAAAHGAKLTDTPVGLNCQIPSATATCTATAGASCPSATVPVASLTGSGITLPAFPNGGSVTVTVRCTVLP
ncbi:DUF11 domain-containing protein [Rhodoferax koreensis]|nr:DUF11 domain-containing protein [Rhodoferax koreense]